MLRPYLQLPSSIYVLCLGTFINRAGTFVVVFMSLYLNKHLGLGVEFSTRAMGAAGIGSFLAGLVGGHLADHFGRRAVMIGAMLGGACIAVLLGTLTTPWLIVLTFGAFTFISDMYRPAVSAMIADLVEPERRPQAYALMYVAINLGFAVAPLVGGRVAEHSFEWLFWGDGATSAVYALIILLAIRETLPARTTRDGTAFLVDRVSSREAALQILRNRVFMRFVLGMWFVAMIFVQSQSTWPIYMSQLGFSERQYGDVIALNGVLIVLAQLPITALSTRFPRGAMLMVAAWLTGVGFALTARANAQWHFAVLTVIWTVGEMIQAPLLSSVVGDLAPAEVRARYMGVLSMSFSLAVAVGSPVGGLVLARWGGGPLWGGCFVLGLIAVLIFASLHRALSRA